ncbi:hypothetical protein E0Z10_g4332 [Xylaria hypoxylon]|uniref:Uncharacterized protein n=1 Tax=Xylaria hypoxylon TaxID=37992 RepID=A0A4Z0YZ33_9PEZI|nr:hypothetical protein E0Z10_g4332 [Xylaria hypoxylon]
MQQASIYTTVVSKQSKGDIYESYLAVKSAQEESRRLPSIAECAAHLELLQAFRHIRSEVESSRRLDEVFGIKPENSTVFRKRMVYEDHGSSWVREAVKLRDDTFEKRREEKWPLFLRLSASRFLSWVDAIEEDTGRRNGPDQSLHIPPLDVLMVWHALLLNPKWFRSFEKRKLERLSTVAFPWQQIHAAISSQNRNWPFEQSEWDRTWFQDKSGLHPDLFGREEGESRGLEPGDVPRISSEQSDLDLHELGFLESCRVAVSKDDTIEKLVDAVKRQSAFVDKMDRQRWIRSPAIEGTLSRGILRYERFLKLFKLYPQTMLVPTLDIDLVWHTHQCSPAQYKSVTTEIAGRFIDHNDRLGTATLDPAFENTEALYRIRYADEYRTCNCWDCEALRSAITEEGSNIQSEAASVARHAYSKVAYYRAVEVARQRGEEVVPIHNLAEINGLSRTEYSEL